MHAVKIIYPFINEGAIERTVLRLPRATGEFMHKNHKLLLIVLFGTFIAFALYMNVFGTNASLMMRFFGISSMQQGFLLTVQSLGGLFMAIYLSLFGERHNKITFIAIGAAVLAFACIGIGFSQNYAAILALMFVAGFGYTNIDIMTNGVIPDVFPKKKNTYLPLAHAFFGIGAMIGPVFASFAASEAVPASFHTPYFIIGGICILAVAALLLVGRAFSAQTPHGALPEHKKHSASHPAEVFKKPTAWLLLLTGVLNFSFLSGVSSWLPSFFMETHGFSLPESGAVLTLFFAGALAMRFISALLLKKFSPVQLFATCSLICSAAMITAIYSGDATLCSVFVFIAGFMQGGNAAIVVIMCCDAFPTRTASASSIMVFASVTSYMTAPLWMGAIAQQSGNFQLPLTLVCITMALSSILSVFVVRRIKEAARTA